MGYPGCFGNRVGLARAREIVDSTMKPVDSTRIAFMMHLLGEKGKTTTSCGCEADVRARKEPRGKGTTAVETVSRCHTTPLERFIASLPISNGVKRPGIGSGKWNPLTERDSDILPRFIPDGAGVTDDCK